MIKNEMPAYELISGALIGIGAIFLILPGFATDFFGFLIIFPPTRKLILNYFLINIKIILKTKNILKVNIKI